VADEKVPSSPDSLQLRGAPLASARVSKKAAFIAIAALALIFGVIIANVSKDNRKKGGSEEATSQKTLQPALNAAQTLIRDVPDTVPLLPQNRLPPPVPSSPQPQPTAGRAPVRSMEDEARLANSAIPKFSVQEYTHPQSFAGESQVEGDGNKRRTATDLPGNENEPAKEPDLNRQADKLAFLEKSRKTAYLGNAVTHPVSPYELKTGTVIPGILASAINSDLPGEIIAQVSRNVYDTASGNYVLIPQGTKIFGHYDSQVAFGQERVLISWQRLIFPDGSTLELEGMSGHDQSGQSGFADRVNNHYGRIFGGALLSSLLAAGAQLSQSQQQSALAVPSSQQIAAAAVGQQVAEVGLEITRRNLRIQPTLEIRKGYRLNVMVNRDIVFPGVYESVSGGVSNESR
jgi:type IV secretion system protein TrbI